VLEASNSTNSAQVKQIVFTLKDECQLRNVPNLGSSVEVIASKGQL
jgi:hypothetical protein